jgi:hypothetical protein
MSARRVPGGVAPAEPNEAERLSTLRPLDGVSVT